MQNIEFARIVFDSYGYVDHQGKYRLSCVRKTNAPEGDFGV